MKLVSNLSWFSEKRDLTLFRKRLRRIRKGKNVRRHNNNSNKNNNMALGGQCSKINNILSICIFLSFATDTAYYYVFMIGFRFYRLGPMVCSRIESCALHRVFLLYCFRSRKGFHRKLASCGLSFDS